MFIVERVISILAPHICVGCGEEGSILCDWCAPDFATPLPSRCYRCKTQIENSLVCKKCRRESSLKHVWVRTEYAGASKRLIYDFKFERKQAAARPLARLAAECLPHLPPDTLVVHVPTASHRVRQRGYDHAQLLAQALARDQNLSHMSVLARVGRTRQVGSTRLQRLHQLKESFRVAKPQSLEGASILLVDDIVTTGGTLEAAARCLKQSGVKQVDAVAFASKELSGSK